VRLAALVPSLGLLLAAGAAQAHPGGLAADGCHKERATGTRHCHPERASDPRNVLRGMAPPARRVRSEAPGPAEPAPFASFASPAPAESGGDELAALIRRLDPQDRAAIERLVRSLAAARE